MSQEERFNTRDRSYSAWHRRHSTKRFVGMEYAQLLAMIDLDACLFVEYDDATKEPVGLIETARDVGQSYKNATVTLNLARRADLPAFVVLYQLSDAPNPADPQWKDITLFRVKRLWPDTEREWREMTPERWCWTLLALRKWQSDQLDQEAA